MEDSVLIALRVLEVGFVLVVPALSIRYAWRLSEAHDARVLADLQAYANARRLALAPGATTSRYTLSGGVAGRPLSVEVHSIPRGNTTRSISVVRLFLAAPDEAAGYRAEGAHPDATWALLGRTAPDVDDLTGMAELPTGDPAFDEVFRGYAPVGRPAPGASPWTDARLRQGLLAVDAAGGVTRVRRTPAELALSLGDVITDPPVLDRALEVAAGAAGVQPLSEGAAAPVVSIPLPEHTRWVRTTTVVAAACAAGVLGMGLGVVNPLSLAVAEPITCGEGRELVMLAKGRGGSLYCVGGKAPREEVVLWPMLTGVVVHFVLVGLVALVLVAVSRRRVQ